MTNVPFSLIKKKYASVAAATAASSASQGVIVFDKKNKVICVDGDVYGGNIQDVNYNTSTNMLTITKADGTVQTLNFSDVASAAQTMAVFGQLRDTIGITNAVQHVQGHYANTNYLQGAQTLIDADKILDTQIHTVQGNLETLQGALADVAFSGKADDVEIDPVTYGGITLQGPDGNAAGNVQDALEGMLQGVVDNELVNEAAFEAVQGAVGLNGNLEFVPHTGANFIQGATNVDQALTDLDNAVQGIITESKSYTIAEQSTAEEGFFKTYQLQEVVGGTATQVGAKINIPKDFLVKNAEVKTVTAADKAEGGIFYNNPDFEVGNKYIDFTVNAKAAQTAGEETHIYLNVKDLVDVYTAAQSATEVQLAIDSNNVISATLVDGGVTTSKIADGAVQTAKIAAQGVTSEKIAAQGVETWNIKNGAVGTDQLADGAVQTNKIAAQGVTSEKIAAQGVQGWNIAQGAITSDKIAGDVVSTPQNTPEVVVNDDTAQYDGTTIATIAGTDIKVKAGMYWSEWSDDEPLFSLITPEPPFIVPANEDVNVRFYLNESVDPPTYSDLHLILSKTPNKTLAQAGSEIINSSSASLDDGLIRTDDGWRTVISADGSQETWYPIAVVDQSYSPGEGYISIEDIFYWKPLYEF